MQFLFTFIFLLIPLVYSLPAASPKSGTDFDFNQEIEQFVEKTFNQDDPASVAAAASLQEFLIDVFNYDDNKNQEEKEEEEALKVFEKRDASTEQTIEGVLVAVNNSGVIWNLLDSIANDPSRIEYIGNLTSSFLKNYNITLNIADLILESSSLTENLNITGLLSAVENSGLITSLLDGILLDENFRPRLVDLIDRLVLSQKDVLLYIFAGVLSKRDFIIDSNLVNVLLKRATNDDPYSGSLGSFLNNAASTILSSSLVSNAAADVLNALNDTGFLVYATKRFLSSDAYVNMTVALVNDIVSSSSVTIDTSGLNLTELVTSALGNPKEIAALVGALLSGDSSAQTSQLSNILGKYSGALSQILQDLEKKGLFAELNSYIFGDSTTKTSATATATATSSSNNDKDVANNNKDAANSGSATSNSQTSTNTKRASNGAGAVIYTGSNTQTTFFKALSILFGGALLFL